MQGRRFADGRMLLAVLVLVIAETAWALFAAEAAVNLLVFYGVLVAASALFFIPGLFEKGGSGRREPLAEAPEADR